MSGVGGSEPSTTAENPGKPEAKRGTLGVRKRRKSKGRYAFVTAPAFTVSPAI